MASTNAPTNPTIYSTDLFGYRFDYSRIEILQLRLRTNYHLSDQERMDLSNEMTTIFKNMTKSAKELLSEHCVCPNPACRQHPFVEGGNHEFLTGEADVLWQKLVVLIGKIEDHITEVEGIHFRGLKSYFEEVEAAWKAGAWKKGDAQCGIKDEE